jgi:hypothetical protein
MTAPTKESVLKNIQKNYGVGESAAASMLAYHNKFSRLLNRIGTEAAVADSGGFETKQGTISSVAEMVSDLAPSVFSSFASLVHHGAHAVEEHSQQNLSGKISQLNPTANPALWCQFTRELADSACIEKKDRLKALDVEHAEILAAKDVARIKKELLTNPDLPEISNQAELIGTKTSETINKDLIKALTEVAKDEHSRTGNHSHSMVDMISRRQHKEEEETH